MKSGCSAPRPSAAHSPSAASIASWNHTSRPSVIGASSPVCLTTKIRSIERIFVVKHTGDDAPMTDGRDVWFHEAMEAADGECAAEGRGAEHPLFILYTSGTPATPDGILTTT